MHWFVDNFALYTGSIRGLFVSDFTPEYDAYIESSVINLRARGIEPFLTNGEQVVSQAETLWGLATMGTPFNQPHVTMFELDMLRADVAIIKDLEAPVTAPQLWYLYHYIVYPRALFNKATVITTSLGLDEFIAYGAECDDFEYAGRKISWEKLIWLIEATMIDLYQFRQVKTDGHPPMLKAEYNLFNAMNERGLPVTAQQVLGDYMLDMSIADRDNRLAIECDVMASLDPNVPNSGEAKKNLVLLSDGWKILRFTAAEIMGDLTACVDAVEQVWTQGRKKSAVGRLMSGRDQPKIPELPVDDDSQKLAITHGAGPVAVTGGAGTGKTSCVSHRVGYLLAQGVCPERILVFSHSEETIAHLKRKVEILTDGQTVQRINFSDWKDLGLRILKENAGAVKRKPPLKLESAPHRVLQRVLKKEMKDIDPLQLELMEADIDEVSIGTLISLYKANLITPERIKEKATTDAEDLVAKLYFAYEDALRKSNKVDPDDCIALVAMILADDPEVRNRYQHKYEYVLVDEYQECTAAADLMARLLSFPQDNIFLAGDEDECVTEGKGALPRMMADMSIRMPNARCYVLDKNWRSHPAIVDHSRSLAAALGIKGIIKDMLPGFGTAATSAVIGPQQSKTEEAEADWVANEVSILIDSGKSPGDIVLLWRNARYASLLEAALFKKNIKCVAASASSEAVPDEIGDVMAFLRLVMDPDGPKARASFERFCQLKSREMDQKLSRLSNTIASFAEANNLSFLKAIEIYHDATADSSCEDLAQLVRIVRTMNQENLPPAQTIGLLKRTQRLNEIYAAVKVPPGVVYEPMRKVEQLEEEAKAYTSVREFVKAKSDFVANKETSTEDAVVQLKSFEDSKGNEYPIAFLTGMAEGVCPSELAANYEEERRLCYVAMTRAKELLYISYPATYEEKPMAPSPFLVEARLLPINVYRKAVDLIQAQPSAKPAQAEPAAPASGMLTPIMTGRPERVRPARAGGRGQGAAPAAPGGGPGAPPSQGTAPGGGSHSPSQAPPQQRGGGNRPGSDVADLLGGRIGSPGGITASGAQPIIRPAGHSAGLSRDAAPQPSAEQSGVLPQQAIPQQGMPQPGMPQGMPQQGMPQPGLPQQQGMPQQGMPGVQGNPGNPFVGFQAEQTRVVDEARQRADNEEKLKAQYEAHITAQQQAAVQAQIEAQKRAEQDAYLQAVYQQQMREVQEANQRAQEEELLRRAEEEAQRKAQYEAARKAEEEAQIRAQQEAEIQAQREAAIQAQQEAQLRFQQEAAIRAQEEAELRAQEEAMLLAIQQEAARKAQEEAEMLARQEAERIALQEAELKARQEAELRAQQEAALFAQQQAEIKAQQEAALRAQQQAEQAQREAALLAQQQAEYQAQQEAALRAQQMAAQAQQMAMQAQQAQQAALQAQQDAMLRAQHEEEMRKQQEFAQQAEHMAQLELLKQQQALSTKAQQDALARVQEKAAQRAMIDLELRMKQDAEERAAQEQSAAAANAANVNAGNVNAGNVSAPQPVPSQSHGQPQPAPGHEQAPPAQVPGDIRNLVDEQFAFGKEEEAEKPVDPARAKEEDMVRSNKEILQDMSPQDREKQQDVLRKKAREKLVAKGRKKKGAAAEPEPVADVAPVAVANESELVPPEPARVAEPPPVPVPTPAEPAPMPTEPSRPDPPQGPPQPPEPVRAQEPPPMPERPVRAAETVRMPAAEPPVSQQPPAYAQPPAGMMPSAISPAARYNVPPPMPTAPAEPTPPPEPMPSPAVPNQPSVYGDPGMVGGPPAGVMVHKDGDKGPAIPDLNQLSSMQSNPWPTQNDQPAVVPPPMPVPHPQQGYPPQAPPGYPSQPQGYPAQPQGYPSQPQGYPGQPQGQAPQQPVPQQPAPQQPPAPDPAQFAQPVIQPVIAKDAAGLPICPQCSASLEANARFCGECGLHLNVRIPPCPSCGLPLEPSAKFCGECGHSLQ